MGLVAGPPDYPKPHHDRYGYVVRGSQERHVTPSVLDDRPNIVSGTWWGAL